MSLIDEYLKKSKTFCIMPFIHINHKPDNKIGTCWRSQPIGNLDKESLEEIWNNEKIKKVRKKMLHGERPEECAACWNLEDSGALSYRQQTTVDLYSKERNFSGILEDLDKKTMQMPFKVPYMEVRLSNKCNLCCRMCSPRFSSQWEREWNENKKLRDFIAKKTPKSSNTYIKKAEITNSRYAKKKLFSFLKKSAPHLRYLMFGGGEPLISNEHYRVLDLLSPYAKNISLEYTSNLTNLRHQDKNILDYWPYFKHVNLKISLDGDPLIYSYIRRNGNAKLPAKNIAFIREKMPPEKIRIRTTCTTSVYNIARLPEIMNWFTKLGSIVHTSIVSYPEFLSVQVLPQKLKEKINIKIDKFLSDLDNNIDWLAHPRWNNENKKTQKKHILLYVKNCQNYMNGKDDSKRWQTFLEFDDILSNKKNSILDIYPEWREYII